MTVFEGRQNDWRRAEFAVQIERMTPFINAPTVILTAPQQMGCFPEVLTVVPHPDLSGFLVHAHPPGIAQTVGPVLRPGVFRPHKGIVLGY